MLIAQLQAVLYLLRPSWQPSSNIAGNNCKITLPNSSYTVVIDRVSTGGNAIAPVRLSVRLFPLHLSNRLTFDLDLLNVYGSVPWLAENRN